jgi:GT2 family glycosyltransferase
MSDREGDAFLLCVVIINFRTPSVTINCLESLLPQLRGKEISLVIVDNCSGDDSVEQIGEWLRLHDKDKISNLISSPVNGGFSFGNNLGINHTRASYYLLLNSDTLVRPGAIEVLLDTARQNPTAGIVSPRLEYPDGEPQVSCFRYPSPVSEFCDAAKTGFIDRILERFQVPLAISEIVSYPQWTSFACVLIKDEMIKSSGSLDDGYFMYFEDAELCYRACRAGWKVIHNPQARIVHLRGGSSPVKQNARLKQRLPDYYYKSRSRFFYQLYGRSGLIAANIFWTFGRLISKCRQIMGRKDKQAIDSQWKDIWINCLQPLEPYTHPDANR